MARHIRDNQFPEDDGPNAHPPVWESYVEPRNLFTNTVYDKGQEIIFMLFSMSVCVSGRRVGCRVACCEGYVCLREVLSRAGRSTELISAA